MSPGRKGFEIYQASFLLNSSPKMADSIISCRPKRSRTSNPHSGLAVGDTACYKKLVCKTVILSLFLPAGHRIIIKMAFLTW